MSLEEMRKAREKRSLHTCRICNREIYPYEKVECIKSRRGTTNYYHRDCIEKEKH